MSNTTSKANWQKRRRSPAHGSSTTVRTASPGVDNVSPLSALMLAFAVDDARRASKVGRWLLCSAAAADAASCLARVAATAWMYCLASPNRRSRPAFSACRAAIDAHTSCKQPACPASSCSRAARSSARLSASSRRSSWRCSSPLARASTSIRLYIDTKDSKLIKLRQSMQTLTQLVGPGLQLDCPAVVRGRWTILSLSRVLILEQEQLTLFACPK